MTIPDFQTIMLPLLKSLGDNKEHSLREVIEHVSELFNLSEEEKKERLPSGQQAIIDNRVGWARTYLKKAGLLEYTRRGHFRITERGLDILKQDLSKIDLKYLRQFPEYMEFKATRKTKKPPRAGAETPRELIEDGYEKIKDEVADELLKLVKESSPKFFENLVIELLLRMGYGGSWKDAGMAIGKSGDEGIDGIIKEDKLGLDNIYIQAKSCSGTS